MALLFTYICAVLFVFIVVGIAYYFAEINSDLSYKARTIVQIIIVIALVAIALAMIQWGISIRFPTNSDHCSGTRYVINSDGWFCVPLGQ